MPMARPANPMIRLVHASVPGRVRLEVAGLYRSPGLKRRLEQQLQSAEGIRSASANIRTGRLLLVYLPDTPVEFLVAMLEEMLGAV